VRIVTVDSKHYAPLVRFLRGLDKGTTHAYTHFGYVVRNPAESARRIIEAIHDGQMLGYALVHEHRILGFGHLDLFAKKEKKHVVKLGLVLHQRYQGKGLGKRLLDSMITAATKMGIEKVWLATYADNTRALQLYLSRGFAVEGIFRKEEKTDGRYRDVISMALFLKPGCD